MRRSPRVVLAWIATLLVALVTARVVTSDLTNLHNRAKTLGKNVRVLLVVHDLPLGSRIAENDLRAIERPSGTVAPDTVHDESLAIGRVLAVGVLAGDALRSRHLAPRDAADVSGAIPKGRRVLHVATADGHQPEPGAIVDVLATLDGSGLGGSGLGGSLSEATVVARGSAVIAHDPAPDLESSEAVAPGVTLLVTEGEARAVAYAAAVGQITLALAPPETACCTSSEP
jgi:Flp pilus assembly protein CpaB